MKSKEQIKNELSQQYFGKEAEEYDLDRTKDSRIKEVLKKQKEIIKFYLESSGKGKILDVACGTGYYFESYPQKEIYGIDISKEMLAHAKGKRNVVSVQVADAEKLPFKDNFFDATISTRFIMHIPNHKKVIEEMVRVTKPGGKIVFDFPNKHCMSYLPTQIRLLRGKLRCYNMFTRKSIQKIARDNNLEIKGLSGNVFFTPLIFPKSFLKFSMFFNGFLLKLFPSFTYVFFTCFEKR